MKSENKKLILRYVEYFNDHEWSKVADLYAEKPMFKDPSFGMQIIE